MTHNPVEIDAELGGGTQTEARHPNKRCPVPRLRRARRAA